MELEEFGIAKEEWFRTFLELPNGIPSHDTFGRFFAALNPDAFSQCFMSWIASVAEVTKGKVVAIDGKTIRRSFDRASSKSAVHIVSAWLAANRMVLGQVRTEEKSNEITAIPRLLELLSLTGCIVTIDAMGCQKNIVQAIVNQNADYVIGLKGNQGTLHDEVRALFDDAEKSDFRDLQHDAAQTVEKDHGRIETRRCVVTSYVDWFADKEHWAGLRSFAMVESQRVIGGKTSSERRYFISSLPGLDAAQMLHAVRTHWSIENDLHWSLDVAFREDESRVRIDNAAENTATLRKVALTLLKQDQTTKAGIAARRKKAGWSHPYLLSLLGFA